MRNLAGLGTINAAHQIWHWLQGDASDADLWTIKRAKGFTKSNLLGLPGPRAAVQRERKNLDSSRSTI
jgi:hypothetical protein